MPQKTRKRLRRRTPTPVANNSSNSSSTHSSPLSSSSFERRSRKSRRIQKENPVQSKDVSGDDSKKTAVCADMHKAVRDVVRNDHVLALVTLKSEDEMAREKQETEQRGAIIITETPSVPKLTRAKARELNCTPGILPLPALNDTTQGENDIKALIREELHSDEDDEEYTFKEDDFHSDDEPNTTSSDMDSNPRTPLTPLTTTEAEDSPVKFTSDGCFKLPPDKIRNTTTEDPRIAARTRSKLCLQQTTIEDLQSEFVPPDVDQSDVFDFDMGANDEHWMQFLNDFTKPLNNTFLGDEDDPINDPEYVGADNLPVDAEELRNVNISKKELTDLVSELFEELLQEGVSLESIELDTPQKFISSNAADGLAQNAIEHVTRNIDFDNNHQADAVNVTACTVMDSFHPNIMSTPSGVNSRTETTSIPAETVEIMTPEIGQIIENVEITENVQLSEALPIEIQDNQVENCTFKSESKCNIPYDANFTWEYISIRRGIYSEYEEKFEELRNVKPCPQPVISSKLKGFTQSQHDMLQQQLRIHTQMLTQTFLQTYSHPLLYSMAKEPKTLLHELHEKAKYDQSFNCWNLDGAIELITKWEKDLSSDECQEENIKMMEFTHKEIQLTDGRTRQVPRLPPRIMDLMLNSTVFMYPQYLPRMAFQPKNLHYSLFAPSEYQLIAMGLEKHLAVIRNCKSIRKGALPVRMACKRMIDDLLHGKQFRRICEKVKELTDSEQYNPVRYYFDHDCAPPIDQTLYGFVNGVVLPPRERFLELPNGWKYYVEKTWVKKRSRRPKEPAKPSALASHSLAEFVREAVGEDLLLPESFGVAAQPDGSVTGSASTRTTSPSTLHKLNKPKAKKKPKRERRDCGPGSLTINVNYVFGGTIGGAILNGAGVSVPYQPGPLADNVAVINKSLTKTDECTSLSLPPPIPPLAADAGPPINLVFNQTKQTVELTTTETSHKDSSAVSAGKHEQQTTPLSTITLRYSNNKRQRFKKSIKGTYRTNNRSSYANRLSQNVSTSQTSAKRCRYHELRQRLRLKLQNRCKTLIDSYSSYLQQHRERYSHAESVQFHYRRFFALDLYTQLLVDLRMFCQSKVETPCTPSSPSTSNAAAAAQQKRQRNNTTINATTNSNNNEDTAASRIRKSRTPEEMLRHMLQPDSVEECNRKDATFAYNFYEKVENALLTDNRVEECQKFNQLLQSFDPKQDKVADLYLKVQKLLLPDYPDLAEVFLNFLLPAEAAELGKFFEHFMVTNATNFINKLNIYFCKQPAQIRKIFACLSELAELPNVSMKKIESKILPLLKGNQFLCDWFLQQFPQAKPPERLLPPPENVNLNEIRTNVTGEYAETISEIVEPRRQQEQQQANLSAGCQLRYINGGIFYGSKVMFPTRLSFMAASIYNEQIHDDSDDASFATCVHDIRSKGERMLSAAMATDSHEEDDVSRGLVIDTTGDEGSSCSSIEICDDAALRAHAMRLNPNYYSSSYFSNATTSTPNITGAHQSHHPNAKKTSINFGETSPRKQQAALNTSPMSGIYPIQSNAGTGNSNTPRKSPTKKMRSPGNQAPSRSRSHANQPMVVIHENKSGSSTTSPAIECAKRLKTLIETSEEKDKKSPLNNAAAEKRQSPTLLSIPKIEQNDEDQEFLSVSSGDMMESDISLSEQPFPAIRVDTEQSEIDIRSPRSSVSFTPQHVITTQFDSDEDCKLDVVATLANCVQQDEGQPEAIATTPVTTVSATAPTLNDSGSSSSCNSSAWTRDEDKILLIEMKIGARNRDLLIKRMCSKLKHRNISELRARHQFLMDFLSKLQGK